MKINKFVVALVVVLAGCSSPQAFNASQSLDSAVQVFEGNKLSNAVTVLADGQTMSIRSRATTPFVSLTITDKGGNEVVSVRDAQDFVWQHPVLQAGQARRLIVRLETSSLPTNVVEEWEALVLGDKLLDLDNQLAAFAAGGTAPTAPAPRPPVAETEKPEVQASRDDNVDLGDVASVRPVAPAPVRSEPRRDPAPAPAPTPPPAQPLTADERALLQRLLEKANSEPATTGTVPAAAPKPVASDTDIAPAAPDAAEAGAG